MTSVVTIKLWNHCQNRCSYCVAHKWHGDTTEIDFDAALDWVDKFRPSADIHISGGEPLFFPDRCEIAVRKALSRKRKVAIFTNGQNLQNAPSSLLECDVFWWITWHREAIETAEEYLELIRPVIGKKLFFNMILSYHPEFDFFQKAKEFFNLNGLDLWPRINWWHYHTAELWGHLPKKTDCGIASSYLTLIEADGSVYPCSSHDWGIIGRTTDLTCSNHKAELVDSHAEKCCMVDRRCGAFLTAQVLGEMWK